MIAAVFSNIRKNVSAYDTFPGNALKTGLKAQKGTTPIPYQDQGCDVVRLSENSRNNFIGRGRSGIIEEGDPNSLL